MKGLARVRHVVLLLVCIGAVAFSHHPVVAVAAEGESEVTANGDPEVFATIATDTGWEGWTCDELTPDLCSSDELDVSTGELVVRGGIRLRYWRYTSRHQRNTSKNTNSTSSNSNASQPLPVIVLHGGPGWPHDYLLPLRQQACRGREVIFYDQAGCGQSSSLSPEKNMSSVTHFPWLIDPSYYATEELPALISHLGLDRYHLLGHSWGTILAQLFALDTEKGEIRNGLASMILSGPLSDAKLYVQAQWDPEEGNLGGLPPFLQDRIRFLQTKHAYESNSNQTLSDEYAALDNVLTSFFTCRTAPAPDCLTRASNNANRQIYLGMQGPSEFSLSGTLGTLNTTGRLGELGKQLPVLLTSGKFDTMRPSVVAAMERAIPVSERLLFHRSGHVSMIDEPGPMNDAIADFFQRVELASISGTPFSPKQHMFSSHDEAEDDLTDSHSRIHTNFEPVVWLLTGAVLVLLGHVVIGHWIHPRFRNPDYTFL